MDGANFVSRAADGGCDGFRVQLCFREDHRLAFGAGGVDLFHRAGFAHSVVDMGFAHLI